MSIIVTPPGRQSGGKKVASTPRGYAYPGSYHYGISKHKGGPDSFTFPGTRIKMLDGRLTLAAHSI